MGFRFSQTNRRISTTGASNMVIRLALRTVMGHELPIHVHQHYALEFHVVLNPNTKSCIRRRFLNARHARQLCYIIRGSALSGLCSCIFDNGFVIKIVRKKMIARPGTRTRTRRDLR